MSISDKSNINQTPKSISSPAPETEANKDDNKRKVEQRDTQRQTSLESQELKGKETSLNSRATTIVANPETFIDQQTSTVSDTGNTEKNDAKNNIDTFFNEIASITDETAKELSKDVKSTKDEMSTYNEEVTKAKKPLNKLGFRCLVATVVACAVAATLLVTTTCTPLIVIAPVALLIAGGICFALSKSLKKENITLNQLNEMATSHKASSLISGIFDNEQIKEMIKENDDFKDIDFNSVTQSIKKSLKNPDVLKATTKLISESEKSLDNKNTSNIFEKTTAKSIESFLDVFFAAVDEDLSDKEKAFIKNIKKESLQAFIEPDQKKFRETILNTVNITRIFNLNELLPSVKVQMTDGTKTIEAIRTGIGNYLQNNFSQDTKL